MKVHGRTRLSILAMSLVTGGFVGACFSANVGDIAQGGIVRDDGKVLVLQSDPCDPDSAKITFVAPWKKRSLGKKTCPDKSDHEIFQIEQQQAADNGNNAAGPGDPDKHKQDKNNEQKSPKKPEQQHPAENDRQPSNGQEAR
jgi:hypothetical protein